MRWRRGWNIFGRWFIRSFSCCFIRGYLFLLALFLMPFDTGLTMSGRIALTPTSASTATSPPTTTRAATSVTTSAPGNSPPSPMSGPRSWTGSAPWALGNRAWRRPTPGVVPVRTLTTGWPVDAKWPGSSPVVPYDYTTSRTWTRARAGTRPGPGPGSRAGIRIGWGPRSPGSPMGS